MSSLVSSNIARGLLRTELHSWPSSGLGYRQWLLPLFLVCHVPLAYTLQQSETVATLHASIILGLGLRGAMTSRVHHVAWASAYIVGAEVVWRMVNTSIFWEFGKYATSAMFLISLLKNRKTCYPLLPTLYFLLLLPAAALIVDPANLESTRQSASFNLSGPFALAVTIWFFSTVQLTRSDLRQMWWMLIAPLITVVTLNVLTINSADALHFGRSSNSLFSGGYGPNQVSNMLGLGTMVTFLLLIDKETVRWLRLLLLALMLTFAAFSALTFSRGGVYAAGGSILVFSLFLLRDRQSRLRLLSLFVLVFIAANYLVLPRLDAFTGGKLVDRFQDTRSTGRMEIVEADLIAFRENLVTGTGLGRSKDYHALTFRRSAAHTEFTRLLAEHGLWGLGALILLLVMAWQYFLRTVTLRDRALVVALIGWSFLFMMQAAMRLAAPAFLFGLSALVPLEKSTSSSAMERR